jgi:RNA polymerase sigma-70 factor (ECF subfamily)
VAGNTLAVVGGPVEVGREAEIPARASGRSDAVRPVGGERAQASASAEVALDDKALLAGLQRQEVGALEAFYDRYHRLALGLAYRMLGDRVEAEDVVQEAFLAVWRRSATFDPQRGSPRGWLVAIVRHRCLDRLRRAPSGGEPVALDETLEDYSAVGVFQSAHERLQREQIVRALRALPGAQREAIELAYFGGWTHVEIAARQRVPLGTVKGRLRIGLQKLRALLDADALGA